MEAKEVTLGITEFALGRHDSLSGFSYFNGDWRDLLELVFKNWESRKPGYKDGVVTVEVDPSEFVTGLVILNEEMPLISKFGRRKAALPGERPFINTTVPGIAGAQAKHVVIVLYSHELLEEEGANSGEADYEIVTINASPYEGGKLPDGLESEPMDPVTMARNFLGLPGGTKAEYSAEQFARSIVFWNEHRMRASRRP